MSKERAEEQYLLRKTLTSMSSEFADFHPWLMESDRWNELVFAFLCRISDKPESEIRELTDIMSNLDLLDIQSLANLTREQIQADESSIARHIQQLMEERGFSPEQAHQGLTTLCNLALGLQKHYDGKIQKYLRHYGELMLHDLDLMFNFSSLDRDDVKYAFTYWLQNALNMPISLVDRSFDDFCKQHNVEPDQFLMAADDLDVNLALVDDMIKLYMLNCKSVQDNESSDIQ